MPTSNPLLQKYPKSKVSHILPRTQRLQSLYQPKLTRHLLCHMQKGNLWLLPVHFYLNQVGFVPRWYRNHAKRKTHSFPCQRLFSQTPQWRNHVLLEPRIPQILPERKKELSHSNLLIQEQFLGVSHQAACIYANIVCDLSNHRFFQNQKSHSSIPLWSLEHDVDWSPSHFENPGFLKPIF